MAAEAKNTALAIASIVAAALLIGAAGFLRHFDDGEQVELATPPATTAYAKAEGPGRTPPPKSGRACESVSIRLFPEVVTAAAVLNILARSRTRRTRTAIDTSNSARVNACADRAFIPGSIAVERHESFC